LCPAHAKKPEWIREKNHFFRLSKYRQALLDFYRERPDFLQPESRRNEILRLVEGGLEDISVSRAGQLWGIPVPFDPDSVVYVWFDALTNYLSAIGFGRDDELFRRWWPVDVHIVGKDITRFHCAWWPAMLLSAGLPLPRHVFAHGWVHFRGQKMSKSLGTIVDPLDAVERFGPDPLRLYLVKEIAFGQDGDFSWERFEERYNVDLANNLGNLVSRVSAMVDRYQRGKLEPASGAPGPLASAAEQAVTAYRHAMERFALHEAAAAAYGLVDATNEFIAATEPWTLARDSREAARLNAVLHEAAEAVRVVAVLLLPIVPHSAAEILRRMGEWRPVEGLRLPEAADWVTSRQRRIAKGEALWPRLEAAAHTQGKEKGHAMSELTPPSKTAAAGIAPSGTVPAPPPASGDERLSIEEFLKIDLRTARIVAAERVPKSRKLLKLTIDVGTEQRTLAAGIADAYEPEALVGRTIVVVANLKPATLMGVESNGMLLAASLEGGKPMLLQVDGEVAPGTRVR
jgi:methionyl-tRNA synthetase